MKNDIVINYFKYRYCLFNKVKKNEGFDGGMFVNSILTF